MAKLSKAKMAAASQMTQKYLELLGTDNQAALDEIDRKFEKLTKAAA